MTKTIFSALFIALVTFAAIACNRTSRPVEPSPAPAEAAAPATDDVGVDLDVCEEYGMSVPYPPTEVRYSDDGWADYEDDKWAHYGPIPNSCPLGTEVRHLPIW